MCVYFARFLLVATLLAVCLIDRQETHSQEQGQVYNAPPLSGQPPMPNQGNPVPQGVEVQARGPVHEAFATPTGSPSRQEP